MKPNPSILFVLLSAALHTSTVYAAEQLVPAGSIVQCVIAEPNVSSETESVGDPVLCELSYVELYGRSEFPYGSYLVGHFDAYKDPGHFVGKGWMELKFDRMLVQPDMMIPVSAKVIDVPDYKVDKEGRIRGKGHNVRDVVEWSLPILWPIDLLNLPRRGPRPALKAETTLTLKIMQDLGIPSQDAPIVRQAQTQPAPTSNPLPPDTSERTPSPMLYRPAPPPVPMYAPPLAPVTLLIMRDGYGMYATSYSLDPDGAIHYTALNGAPVVLPLSQLNMARTVEVNQMRGVSFSLQQPDHSLQQSSPGRQQPTSVPSPYLYTVANRY